LRHASRHGLLWSAAACSELFLFSPFPLLVFFVLVLFPSCIPQMVYVNILRWDQSSTVTAASLFFLPKSQLLARTLPYMNCRRTRKSRSLRSTPKSGSLGVVVGLAGVSFLLIRISEISGGRTVSLRCNPLGLSYGQHSTTLSPVVLVASQLFRRITSLQLQVTTRSRSAKREEMSSNIPSTSKLYALTLTWQPAHQAISPCSCS